MGMYGGITGSVLLSKDNLEDLKSVNNMDYIFDCCGEGLEFIEGLEEGFSREIPFDDKINLVFATATKAWRLVEILDTLLKVAEAYVIYYSDEYGEKSVYYKDTEDECYIFNSKKFISKWVNEFDYSDKRKNKYIIEEEDWRKFR